MTVPVNREGLSMAAARTVVVDIADIKVSEDPEVQIITYALGSCIAVIVYDPTRRVGGMIHFMLPHSKVSPDKARQKPAMFADLGVPMLFQEMYARGCQKKDLVVKVAGGAALYDDKGTFDIGKRNYTIMRKMFWKNNVIITAEDVGGKKSRTVRLFVGTGRVTVRGNGEEADL